MGKQTKAHRHLVIKHKNRRHEKIEKLRAKYLTADQRGKEAIVQKLKKINAQLGEAVKAK